MTTPHEEPTVVAGRPLPAGWRRWLVPEAGRRAPLLPPSEPTGYHYLAWWAILALVTLFLIPAPYNPLVVADDARQQIAPYWRFHHPGVLADSFIVDYLYAYTTTGHKALYYVLTYAFNPFKAAKIVTMALLGVMFIYFVLLGRVVSLPAAGAIMGVMLLKSPLAGRISGGLPRSFAPLLMLLFVYYSVRGSERGLLVVLLLAAAFYPSALPLCGLAYVFWLVWEAMGRGGRWLGPRLVRLGLVGIACLLLMAPNLRSPAFMGRLITAREAATMPEWGPHGRFRGEFPFFSLPEAVARGIESSFRAMGPPFHPNLARADAWLRRPFCFLWLAVGAILLAVRREGRPFLVKLACLGLSSTLMYVLAVALAFRLFLPSRMIAFGWPFASAGIVCLGLAVAPTWAYRGRRVDPREALLLLLLFSTLLLYGPGTPRRLSDLSLADLTPNAPLYDFFSTLPPDVLVGGVPGELDNVMSVAARRPYVTFESAHPFYDRYYAEVARRLNAFHDAYFARDANALRSFLAVEKIDYLLADRQHFQRNGYDLYCRQFHGMEPYNTRLRERLADVPPEQFVLGAPDLPGVVFVHGSWFVVEAKAFLRATATHP